MQKIFILSGSLLAALAVIMGAFGAHSLKAHLSNEMLDVYKTAVDYHIYHALGLILVGLLPNSTSPSSLLAWAGSSMLMGILLFSGSLYILSITGIRWLGAIAPFGGTAFILGWILLASAVWSQG